MPHTPEHLRDSGELAADIIVSVAGYPQEAALRPFSPGTKQKMVRLRISLNDAVFRAVRRHLKKAYGFDFSTKLLPGQNLQYLAGMIHDTRNSA